MAPAVDLTTFEAHLRSLDPSQTYFFEHVTGAQVNITVRAIRRTAGILGLARWIDHGSLIMKYAPPYVAALGGSAPFSQHRQNIEAQALGVFGVGGELNHIAQEHDVEVPACLHYDADAHILIMSDLGFGQNLSEILIKITANPANLNQFPNLLSHFTKLGPQIGAFFANLHSSLTARRLFQGELNNPDVQYLVLELNVKPVKEYLDRVGVYDSEELTRRIGQDFLHARTTDYIHSMRMFSFGDAWTGAIHLTEKPEENDGDLTTYATGIVDWEFATMPGRGPNGDMALLLADLHGYILENEGKEICENIQILITGITDFYRETSYSLGSPWVLRPEFTPDIAGECATLAQPFIRSAYILHGRELIVGAFNRIYDCRCCKGERTDKCVVRKKIVERGCWYLRAVGGGDRSFDWKKFGREEGLILQGLFYGYLSME